MALAQFLPVPRVRHCSGGVGPKWAQVRVGPLGGARNSDKGGGPPGRKKNDYLKACPQSPKKEKRSKLQKTQTFRKRNLYFFFFF